MEHRLRETLERDARYLDAARIAATNSKGHVWLVGGYVARTLAQLLYGTPLPEKVDVDFVCEGLVRDVQIPEPLRLRRNRFGNPRINGEGVAIDLMPFTTSNFSALQRRELPLTIENVIDQSPLTIGAIGYEPSTGRLFGDVGIRAVETRTVAVHDAVEARDIARRMHWTVEHLVEYKAASYGFTPILPPKSS